MAFREDIESIVGLRFGVLPAALVAGVLMLASGAGASVPGATPGQSEDPLFTPVTGPADSLRVPASPAAGRGIHLSSLENAEVPPPSRRRGTYTARIVVRTVIRDSPGGSKVWVARGWARWSGGVQRLMVLGSRTWNEREWLKVRLPERPNGGSGWLPRDRVVLRRSPHFMLVDRKQRRSRFSGTVAGKPGSSWWSESPAPRPRPDSSRSTTG